MFRLRRFPTYELRLRWEPQAHTFFADHVPWVTLGDELPRLDRDNELLAKFQCLPRRP
jgi:hypothetical protein